MQDLRPQDSPSSQVSPDRPDRTVRAMRRARARRRLVEPFGDPPLVVVHKNGAELGEEPVDQVVSTGSPDEFGEPVDRVVRDGEVGEQTRLAADCAGELRQHSLQRVPRDHDALVMWLLHAP